MPHGLLCDDKVLYRQGIWLPTLGVCEGNETSAWDAKQVYLDKQGRAQLAPLFHEIPQAEANEVYALGQLIWQVASRKTELAEDWQQGGACHGIVRRR